MKDTAKGLSIRYKMYIFIAITVLVAVAGTAVISYRNNSRQIGKFYKSITISSARNFSMLLDGEYLSELRAVVETDEYAAIHDRAEAEDNEELVREYLEVAGLWEGYVETSRLLNNYLDNTDNIKYLYLVILGDENATQDMYLMDDDENPIYQTGYIEDREEELMGIDGQSEVEPTISNGDWGWLCSAFVPVYDAEGNVVCHVGCDIGMNEVMLDSHRFMFDVLMGALFFTAIAVCLSSLFAYKFLVRPLRSMTRQMSKFKPSEGDDYDAAGVVHLDLPFKDEINDLYLGIRQMQIEIIDYISHMSRLRKDKERAENDIRVRDERIDRISQDAYRDGLTEVGNKSAYNQAVEKLNGKIGSENTEFAVIMMDINDLKKINDEHGHECGDEYIKGCSKILCDAVPHSPVFRIGGDEFVAILEGADYERRKDKLDSIRRGFAEAIQQTDVSPWLRFSAAVGMAENTRDDKHFDAVFKRADEEMYRLKKKYKEQNGSYR